ncbi:MAG TPA: DUF2062 domain-containing protein [Thermoanaerobaculaceae bacterium]|nr:DUF2062 domain-containing protein [Thermoanaerobaculaceae bacterium]
MKALLEKARSRFQEVVGVHEPPERLAAAWALGIALGLSPLLGLHTVIALLLALALRLNKVDVLLGTLIVNPWTLPVYFPAAVFVGRRITGVHVPRFLIPRPEEILHAAMWRDRAPWLRSFLIVWGVGASVLALLGGLTTYLVLKRLIVFHRVRHAAKIAAERKG